MQVQVERDTLNKSLSWVNIIIPKKPQVQALSALYTDFKSCGELTITGSNLEMQRSVRVDNLIISRDKKMLMPGKSIQDMLEAITEDNINLKIDDTTIDITYGKRKARFNCQDISQYPGKLEMPGPETQMVLKSQVELRNAIKGVLFACPARHSHPVFTGVNILITTSEVSFIATDTKVIAKTTMPVVSVTTSVPGDVSHLVSGEHLKSVLPLLSSNDKVSIWFGNNLVRITDGDIWEQIMRQLAGIYPVVPDLFKRQVDFSFKCNREEFLLALKRVLVLVENNTATFEVNPTNQVMSIVGYHQERGNIEDGITINSYNGNLSTGPFDADISSLIDVLSNIPDDEILFGISNTLAVVKNQDSSYEYLVRLK